MKYCFGIVLLLIVGCGKSPSANMEVSGLPTYEEFMTASEHDKCVKDVMLSDVRLHTALKIIIGEAEQRCTTSGY